MEKAVLDMAVDYPAYGQLRVSSELKKNGVLVLPGEIRSVWLRNDLVSSEAPCGLEDKDRTRWYSTHRNPIESFRKT